MLNIYMYHQINKPPRERNLAAFEHHLANIAQHYAVVLPGEPLEQSRPSLCLTFDDAYCDFYFNVFPLLQRYQLPAVLAVPVQYIQDTTTLEPAIRLAVSEQQAMEPDIYPRTVPFCTWQELDIMARSGLVQIASHGMHHVDMTRFDIDLQAELQDSKTVLEQRLGIRVNTFIYPYGKMNRQVLAATQRHYDYSMRIGSALNWNWQSRQGLLCRVNAEPYWQQKKSPSRIRQTQYMVNYFKNQLRCR